MSNRKHFAKYGNIKLERAKYPECKDFSFIIHGEYSCCDIEYKGNSGQNIVIEVCPRQRRKDLSKGKKKEILESQEFKCIYCGIIFGEPFLKKGKICYAKPTYDHFTPYSYTFNNYKENFVGACQICNRIKYNKIFDSIEEAKNYVNYRRKRMGIEKYEEVFRKNLPE